MEPARRFTPEPRSLIPIREPRSVVDHSSTLWSLIEHALAGLKPATRKAYGEDLAAFAAWMGAPGTAQAAAVLVAQPHGDANALAFEYRSSLLTRKLAASTVNRAMAAIKFVARMARLGGQINWELEIPSLKVETYRNTMGPGRKSVSEVVQVGLPASLT